jgi:hypothetical protein
METTDSRKRYALKWDMGFSSVQDVPLYENPFLRLNVIPEFIEVFEMSYSILLFLLLWF